MLVHEQNLTQKENDARRYADETSKFLLRQIREQYAVWHDYNTTLVGPYSLETETDTEIIHRRVEALNQYKDFLDQQVYAEHFDSRSNLHSTVLEQFLYYLFRDLVSDFGASALVGKSHAFKDIFFIPPNYQRMVSQPYARIERKDHDFVIGVKIGAEFTINQGTVSERHFFDIPAIAIECKTYLDKTMLEGAASAASELKARHPNAMYLVAAEWLKLTESVNLQKYNAIDQIFVFRKQKNTDRDRRFLPGYAKNPIYVDVIEKMYTMVRRHLTFDWEKGIEFGLKRGWLI